MYCNRCGNNLPAGSRFCSHCGNRVQGGDRQRGGRQIPTPMARPARRRLVIENDFFEEPFIEDNEDQDFEDYDEVEETEETIFVITPSFYEVGIQYATAIILSLLITAITAYFNISLLVALGFAILCFIRPVYHHIQLNHTIYSLTTVKIEIQSGLFSKTSRNIPLRHVQDVTVNETFKERLLGIGDVVIDSAAIEGTIPMRNIKDPRKYADLILNELQYWN